MADVQAKTGVDSPELAESLYFEANRGHMDRRARFVLRGNNYTLHLTEAALVMSLYDAHATGVDAADVKNAGDVLRMRFVGADNAPALIGEQLRVAKSHYYIGASTNAWMRDIPQYGRVRYEGLYPGVDLLLYGHQQRLEYDYIVAPYADPAIIAMDFTGAEVISLDDAGNLVIETKAGRVIQQPPRSYQLVDGVEQLVESAYVLENGRVSFSLDVYDPTLPLVIDPVLSYATYLGGGGLDKANDVVVDADGNVYVTGQTLSADFPSADTYTLGGAADVFLAKYDPSGVMLYSVIMGSNAIGYWGGQEQGHAVVLAADGGDVYLAGTAGTAATSSFPVTADAYRACTGLYPDAFVARLNAASGALEYATCFGGSGVDDGQGLAVDPMGRIWLVGYTTSIDFPVTIDGSSSSFNRDAFFAVIDPAAGVMDEPWVAYLAGTGTDEAQAIAYSALDNSMVITGVTNSPGGLPGCWGCDEGGTDVFVAKYAVSNGQQLFNVIYGGQNGDDGVLLSVEPGGSGLAVDAGGNIYLASGTTSDDLPVTQATSQTMAARQMEIAGAEDAFLAQLDLYGDLRYLSYFGGSGADAAGALAVDSSGGRIVLTGRTTSPDLPGSAALASQYPYSTGTQDAFIARFDGLMAVNYAFPYGGDGDDAGLGIALHSSGVTLVVGSTDSSNLLEASTAISGQEDGFMVKVAPAYHDLALILAAVDGLVVKDGAISYRLTVANNGPDAVADIIFTAVLPAELAFVDASPGCIFSDVARVLSCDVPDLDVGAESMLTFDVTVAVEKGFAMSMQVYAGLTAEDVATANNSLVLEGAPGSPIIIRDEAAGSGMGSGGGWLGLPGLLGLLLAAFGTSFWRRPIQI